MASKDLMSHKAAFEYVHAEALGKTHTEVERITGLSHATVYNRRNDPDWQDIVVQYRERLMRQGHQMFQTRLANLLGRAFEGLEELLDSDDDKVRLGAIRLVMDHARQMFEALDTPDEDAEAESNIDGEVISITPETLLLELNKAEGERRGEEPNQPVA